MKPATEVKLLSEFLRICDDPDGHERKYRRNAWIAFTVAMLFVFFCLSDNIDDVENVYYIAVAGFLSGTAFGLGIWFSQAASQTRLMVAHVSSESMRSRVLELEKKEDAT
jgi:hypothetical protein